MRIYDCEQGSHEWQAVRLGIPTASRFDLIITPKTLQPSKSAGGYIDELVAEWVIGEPMDNAKTQYMERGTELEEAAVNWYEFDQDVDTEAVGFVADDNHHYGCSPDRLLVWDSGGAEIKCPGGKKHIEYLRNIDSLVSEYRCQVQGCLWICEREWWDMVVYNPSQYIPNIRHRVYRDEPFILALKTAVREFCERLDQAKSEARDNGCTPWCETPEYATIIGSTLRHSLPLVAAATGDKGQ